MARPTVQQQQERTEQAQAAANLQSAQDHIADAEPETLEEKYAALQRRFDEMAALLASRDREVTDEDTGDAYHLRDSPYAHGAAVPQDASAYTIDNLASDGMRTFYMSPDERAELIRANKPDANPEDFTHIIVRKPGVYKNDFNRVMEIKRRSGQAAFVLEGSPWEEMDVKAMAVPKSMIAARDREDLEYRKYYESGMKVVDSERPDAAGFVGYLSKHTDYPDGRNPFTRDSNDVRAEHDRNVAAGVVGPTRMIAYEDVLRGTAFGSPAQTRAIIDRDEARARRGNRHQHVSQERLQEMFAGTVPASQQFSAGAVGFGPQTPRERTAALAAARQEQQKGRQPAARR